MAGVITTVAVGKRYRPYGDRPRGDAEIARIVEHLGQWYKPVRHEKDSRYCAGENYWDSLFVLKELCG